jgi:sialate O-acetylesterase
VPTPVAVRYGFIQYQDVNLYNAAGLPAVPFRTDDWPLVEEQAKGPAEGR